MLRLHPEVRALFGPRRITAAWIALGVVTQVALAAALQDARWWVALLIAYGVGAPIVHGLGVLIHECAHNLVFRGSRANKIASLVANLPLLAPGAIDFREKHVLHHKRLGQGPEQDFQAPTPEAARWVGTSRWRKLVWLSVGSLVFPKRDIEGVPAKDPWRTANLVAQIVFVAAVIAGLGIHALAYLGVSALFAFGPHPLGMRGYAEHVPVAPRQPTASYYGIMNLVSFNVGHHVEHHDFPAVPWMLLPELRRRAAPFYASLVDVRSWLGLLVSFLWSDRYRVDSYVGGSTSGEAPSRGGRESGGERAPTR